MFFFNFIQSGLWLPFVWLTFVGGSYSININEVFLVFSI
jgi:hypothetical protein